MKIVLLIPALLLSCLMAFAQPAPLSLVAPLPGQITVDARAKKVDFAFGTVFYSNVLNPRETYSLTFDIEYKLTGMPGFEIDFNFDPGNSNISPTPKPNPNILHNEDSETEYGVNCDDITDGDHGSPEPFGVYVDLISFMNPDTIIEKDTIIIKITDGFGPTAFIEFNNGQLVSPSGNVTLVKPVKLFVSLSSFEPKQHQFATTSTSLVDPNPVVSTATIAAEVSSVTVLDLQGKVWFSSKASGANQSINLSHLPAGMYIMRAQTAEGIKQEMIFKE